MRMRLLSLFWRKIKGETPVMGAAKEEADDGN